MQRREIRNVVQMRDNPVQRFQGFVNFIQLPSASRKVNDPSWPVPGIVVQELLVRFRLRTFLDTGKPTKSSPSMRSSPMSAVNA